MWWHPHHRCSRQVKRPHSTVAHFTLSNASSTTASYFTPWQLVLQLNCTAFRMVSANLAKSLFSATIRNHTEFEAVILNNHVSIHLPLSAWTLVTSSSYCYSSLVISLLWKQEIESGKFNAEIANRIFWIFQCFHNVGSGFMPEYLIISNSMTIPVWISFQWNKKAGKTIAKSWQITKFLLEIRPCINSPFHFLDLKNWCMRKAHTTQCSFWTLKWPRNTCRWYQNS